MTADKGVAKDDMIQVEDEPDKEDIL